MIDLDALKAKLAEYDDALPRCPQKVARTVNHAPDFVATDDPTRSDWNVTTYSPCCRPEGHEGECRNSRLILGWPGFVTLSALIAEATRANRLRAEVVNLQREVERLRAGLLDIEQIVHDGMGVARAASRDDERAAVVAFLREVLAEASLPLGVSQVFDAIVDAIERGEHREENE